jgi:hypothetical protein
MSSIQRRHLSIVANVLSVVGLVLAVGGVMLTPFFGCYCLLLSLLGLLMHTPLGNVSAKLHWQAQRDALGYTPEMEEAEREREKQQAARIDEWERQRQRAGLTCPHCRKLGLPIPDTGNRYRCPAGHQFTDSAHDIMGFR